MCIRDRFNAAYDSFLKVGIQKLVAVNRHPIEFVGKGVELSMLVGIAELELLFGQFKVQIQHIVGDVYKRQKQYILPLPSLAEQQRIVAKIEETFSIFDGIQNSLEA